MQINNFINQKLFLIVFFFYIVDISFLQSENQYLVKNVYVELNLKNNKNYRKKAIEISYEIALSRFLNWITVKKQNSMASLIKSIKPKDYISGYSIESEKFKKDNYSALISVNFYQKKIENLLNINEIKYFAKKGPKTLIIPIIKFENRLVLWDDPNPWFDAWLKRPLDPNLTVFMLPLGEVNDLITLSAEDAINFRYYKIKNLANKYKSEDVIVVIIELKENNDSYLLSLKAINGFTKNKIFSNEIVQVRKNNLSEYLLKLANNFAEYYDDLWVYNNLEKMNFKSKTSVKVKFNKFSEWINAKNFLLNNDKIEKFKILKISNKNALIEIDIVAKDKLMEELKQNNYMVYKEADTLLINTSKEN